ncbi:hypothetical protein BKA70DRAFT_1271519 [Coprinopsis sp. MPI-PUGE-AT-0042]|nr:hypothetical protein BKA70DRAFT_1271519 [Coprinopsis sp. MPI-PUGE-AT-0042]
MIISDKKYACETCIKGHRSSSCKHFDRPLFEIKKKGRPITQCEHCRELRKTKQVHVKCICEGSSKPSAAPAEPGGSATKKVNKPGFESAAFPNGLPLQASGTLVASPSRMTHESESGCNCASSGTCGCCVPKKNQTHRRSRTTSSLHPGGARMGPAADLRPVLPGPPPPQPQQQPELFLGGLAAAAAGHHHDPSRGLYHNYARHDAYSPYGRAYDVHNTGHQQQPPASTTAPPAADSNMLQQQQQQAYAFPTCNCGPGCQCRGCSHAMGGGGGGTCNNPDTCASCLDCSITALQPFLSQNVDASAGISDSSIDDWLRSLPPGGPDPSTSTSFLDDDLIAASNALSWDPNIPNITFEGDSDFTTTSIFRLASGSSGGQGYPYLDPNFLDGVRFDTSTELRPRSHSPASAMHLARGGATMDMDMGLGSSSASSNSEAQLAITPFRRHSNHNTMQDGLLNLGLNVAGMRSAPQLNQLLPPDIVNNPYHSSSSVSPVQYAPSSNSDSDTSLRDNLRY